MVFWFIRYDENRLSTPENRSKMNWLLHRLKKEVNREDVTLLVLNVTTFTEYYDEIFDNIGANAGGDRDIDDSQQLYQTFKDLEVENQIINICIASKFEIDCLAKYYNEQYISSDYDALVVSIENNIWYEKAKEFQIMNTNLSLEENLKTIICASLCSEIAGNYSNNNIRIQSVYDNIKNCNSQVKMLNNFYPNVENLNKESQDSEIKVKLKSINDIEKKISLSIKEAISNCEEVKSGLNKNSNSYNKEYKKMIKYPTSFSEDNILISEKLSNDHLYHLFTLTNNTTFTWENLTIFTEAKKIRIAEVALLECEAIEKQIDYDFELINELGYYDIQVFYCGKPVSNKIYVSRVNIVKFYSKTAKIASLITQNIGPGLKNCIILLVKDSDQSIKPLTTSLKSFAKDEIVFQNLTVGESYTINIKKDNKTELYLCPPFKATLLNS